MAREDDWKLIERGIAGALRVGSVSVPALLLKLYRHMKLGETEAMLLIHLIAFQEKEGKSFPTIEELQNRMAANPDVVVKALERLVKEQYVQIDEETDPISGVRGERYNLTPLYRKLAVAWLETAKQNDTAQETGQASAGVHKEEKSADLFTIFESEFARPLTPMECETIAQWVDKDKYPNELILLALKEAVFAGAVHFRYIDRILLEWQRNRIHTPEQAKEYAQKFRGAK